MIQIFGFLFLVNDNLYQLVDAGCSCCCLLLFSHSGAERETEVWVNPALASPLLGWGRLIHTITTTVQSTTIENTQKQYFRYFLSSFFWYICKEFEHAGHLTGTWYKTGTGGSLWRSSGGSASSRTSSIQSTSGGCHLLL